MSIQVLSKVPRPYTNVSLWKISNFTRFKSNEKCASHDYPICSDETLKQNTCTSKLRRLDVKEEPPKIDSMWKNPECCKDPCPDFIPRFDELYYQSSDRLKRNYQQTWASCPKPQFEPKKICFKDKFILPPMEKRERKKRPQTACPAGGTKICMDKTNRKCPRVMMPGCHSSRQPPKCKRQRSISDCLKECTPYPSYSESLRKPEAGHPHECQCLNHPFMCEVWAEMRRQMTFVKAS